MQLRYKNDQGQETIVHLGAEPVVIGRALDADVCIPDEKASRRHCEIRVWNGDYVVKDLRSRNSTFVNENEIAVHQLKPGDRLRVGGTTFHFEEKTPIGANTALQQIQEKMNAGKGYKTILQEIVDDIDHEAAGDSDGDAAGCESPAPGNPA